jgi:hypothetical protein
MQILNQLIIFHIHHVNRIRHINTDLEKKIEKKIKTLNI